jgi:hypothetical protein
MNQPLYLDKSWDTVSAIPEARTAYHQTENLRNRKIITDGAD